MFRRVRRLVGLDQKSPDSSAKPSNRGSVLFRPPDMLETVHEIAVYIHRFHNLDLFQQGWYKLKVSLRWEDESRESHGIPSRVVQYEAAPEAVSDETVSVWHISDSENCFYTQPFHIKYARQDVYLSVMVSFNLIIREDETPSSSSVILKFELIYNHLLGNAIDQDDPSNLAPVAIHEFRVPHKALLGLHSYCPVHFDVFHSVLVDLSVHVAYLKPGTSRSTRKVYSSNGQHLVGEENGLDLVLGQQGWGNKAIETVKSLLASREILLEELRNISSALNQIVEELHDNDLSLGKYEAIVTSRAGMGLYNGGSSGSRKKGVGQLAGILHNFLETQIIIAQFLLEELKKISQFLNQIVEELRDNDLSLGKYEAIMTSQAGMGLYNGGGSSGSRKKGVGQLAGILHNFLEKSDGAFNIDNDVMLYTLSKVELLDLFHTLGSQLSFIWNAFLRFHRINRFKIMDYLHATWASDRKTEWSIWTVHSKIEIPHRYLRSGADESSSHRNSIGKMVSARKINEDPTLAATSRAELHRKSIAQMRISTRSIQDMQIFGDPTHVPVVVIEHHLMNVPQHNNNSIHNSPSNSDQSSHNNEFNTIVLPKLNGDVFSNSNISNSINGLLGKTRNAKKGGRVLRAVVFVHGFQGHHLDLRLVRNQWLLLDPGADCLMSEANEEKTSGDFREMGARLAEEVVSYLRKRIEKLNRYGGCKEIKLSFVGHSIGNIIIRSALSETTMSPYLKHLHTYMSISGPHLGYCYSSNSLFNSGLWLLKKLNKVQCIHQLTMTDDPDLRNTFFYKLCKEKTLEHFKNIILLSSPQDGYVPYHSARIELSHSSSHDNSKKGEIFMDMLNSCLDQIRAPTSETRILMRCDVNFDNSNQSRSLNTIIGRAAHIEFLETDVYVKFIMWSFPELFR